MMVTPVARIARISSTRRRLSTRLRPAAGSSSSSSAGFATNARAISRRRWVPCGRVPAGRLAMSEKSDEIERLACALGRSLLLGLLRRRAQERLAEFRARPGVQADHDVLDRAHLAEQLQILEGAADAGPRPPLRRPARDVAVLEADMARRRRQVARDQVEQGRLPRPVRPDQPVHRAAGDLHVDGADGDETAEMPRQGGDREKGRHHTPGAAAFADVRRCHDPRTRANRSTIRPANPRLPVPIRTITRKPNRISRSSPDERRRCLRRGSKSVPWRSRARSA